MAKWKLDLDNPDQTTIMDPSWDQIEQALDRLDGENLDNLSLTRIGKGSLICGGGNFVDGKRRYIVTYQPENDDDSVTLVDPSLSGPDIELTVQSTVKLPAEFCVKKPLMKQAFKRKNWQTNLFGNHKEELAPR